jgi:hypothetical protein
MMSVLQKNITIANTDIDIVTTIKTLALPPLWLPLLPQPLSIAIYNGVKALPPPLSQPHHCAAFVH